MAQAGPLEEAQAMLVSDPGAAATRAEAILRAQPNDPRAALILASARRRLGEVAGAHAVLAPLSRAFPRAALTQYELGLVLIALGKAADGIAALERATTLQPDLAEAWLALGEALFVAGESQRAEQAFAHRALALTDPDLKPAAAAMFAGRLGEAGALLRDRLAQAPEDAAALHLLADIAARAGREAEAELLLARSLAIDPDDAGARFAYADLLFRRQDGEAALVQLEPLLAASPESFPYRNLMAACLALLGRHDEAIALYRALLEVHGRQPKLWLNLGHALRTIGEADEAAMTYRRAISLQPALGEAWWSLANLKTGAIDPDETAAMVRHLRRGDLADEDRLHLCYALGRALEDAGEDAAAFSSYAEGARLRRVGLPYAAETAAARCAASMKLFTPDFFADRAKVGSPSAAPIFIVGLPRSGSTLVEQILASHSAVEGTMELPDIGFLAGTIPPPYPERLAELEPGQFAALGEAYLERTAIHRRQGRPRFIDKMPNNFHHLGFIHLILPRARIIDARRHPMAVGYSVFKQLFHRGQAFSYDLTDIARYYRDYLVLMAHFEAVLPGRVHRLIYEDLVDDTEGEVRRLLAYLQLPFEPACLRFHQTRRAVRTVSSEQVRRPIYREGLEQWRRFEAELGPLAEALGPALDSWRS